MPLYSYKCPNGHITEIIAKYSETEDTMVCYHDLVSYSIQGDERALCGELMVRQVGLTSKPVVHDRDLMQARTHSGSDK